MSKEQPVCPHCGALLVEYRFSFCQGLRSCLFKIAQKVGVGSGEVWIKDLRLTQSEYTNVAKLRYWGLIEKVNEKEGKGGVWRLTDKGRDFCAGRSTIASVAITRKGEVVRCEGPQVDVSGQERPVGWDYRSHYADQARKQIQIAPGQTDIFNGGN